MTLFPHWFDVVLKTFLLDDSVLLFRLWVGVYVLIKQWKGVLHFIATPPRLRMLINTKIIGIDKIYVAAWFQKWNSVCQKCLAWCSQSPVVSFCQSLLEIKWFLNVTNSKICWTLKRNADSEVVVGNHCFFFCKHIVYWLNNGM